MQLDFKFIGLLVLALIIGAGGFIGYSAMSSATMAGIDRNAYLASCMKTTDVAMCTCLAVATEQELPRSQHELYMKAMTANQSLKSYGQANGYGTADAKAVETFIEKKETVCRSMIPRMPVAVEVTATRPSLADYQGFCTEGKQCTCFAWAGKSLSAKLQPYFFSTQMNQSELEARLVSAPLTRPDKDRLEKAAIAALQCIHS